MITTCYTKINDIANETVKDDLH